MFFCPCMLIGYFRSSPIILPLQLINLYLYINNMNNHSINAFVVFLKYLTLNCLRSKPAVGDDPLRLSDYISGFNLICDV